LCNGSRPIDWPRVVGAAYKKAQKVADDVGAGWLGESHLGGSVWFTDVKYREDIDVGLTPADAARTVAVVKEIALKMVQLGFSRVGPSDRRAKDSRGRVVRDAEGKLLSHDLVYEWPPWELEHRGALCKPSRLERARCGAAESAEGRAGVLEDNV
jgi:hypothetical protein